MATPRCPKGLGPSGRRLWRSTLADRDDGSRLELRGDELVLLAEACRLVDDVERLREALADEPLTVKGSQGQDVAHPLRGELHRTIGTLDRVLRTLSLPDAADTAADRSWAGRNLARARWAS